MRARNNQHLRGVNIWAGKEHPRGQRGKPAWNRGRTLVELYGEERAEKIRASSRAQIAANGAQWSGDPHKEEQRRLKISIAMRKYGGYRRGSGRGKKGWYRGIWCDSTYELVYAVYCLDHGLPFARNHARFAYTYEGQQRTWMPDFILPDGSYVEIKGYQDERSRAKIRAFPGKLVVLKREDMATMFAYVEKKYGKNFVQMYESADAEQP
jgi:hypothetical protein